MIATAVALTFAVSMWGPQPALSAPTKGGAPTAISGVAAVAAGGLSAVTPVRLLDTRGGAAVAGKASVELQVTGRGGVPASGAGAVVLNVTVTQPGAAGYLTVFPTGATRPTASNLNFVTGQTIPNAVTVKLGAGGRVTIYNGGPAPVHVIVDLAAWASRDCDSVFGTFGAGAHPSGCWRPYADTSAFNTAVTLDAPTDARSSQIVAQVIGVAQQPRPANLIAHTHGSSGEPTFFVRSNDPTTFNWYQVTCTEFGGTCSINKTHLPGGIPVPAQAVREGDSVPASAEPPAGSDRHITVVDQTTGWEYDLWHVQWPPTGNQLTIGNGGRTRIDGDGTATREGGDGTAAGFGDLAGRVRAEELTAGHIDHALFVNLYCDNGTVVYPAWKRAGRNCATVIPGGTDTDAPPMGTRLQLRMSSQDIDALTIPTWKKTLLHAMADYGMFFGDTAGSNTFAFTIETESGNQYTSLGDPDLWLQYTAAAGWPLLAASTDYPWEHRLGYFGNDADNRVINTSGLTWAQLWATKLVVLAPCVSDPAC